MPVSCLVSARRTLGSAAAREVLEVVLFEAGRPPVGPVVGVQTAGDCPVAASATAPSRRIRGALPARAAAGVCATAVATRLSRWAGAAPSGSLRAGAAWHSAARRVWSGSRGSDRSVAWVSIDGRLPSALAEPGEWCPAPRFAVALIA